jgi:hypothetical protein
LRHGKRLIDQTELSVLTMARAAPGDADASKKTSAATAAFRLADLPAGATAPVASLQSKDT